MQLRMSQQSLADACGVSFQQIQKYERGSNRVSFSRLLKIAAALKCSAAELVATIEEGGDQGPAQGELVDLLRVDGAFDVLRAFGALRRDDRRAVLHITQSLGAQSRFA